MTDFVLSAIYLYPVKSCAGIAVSSWEVNSKGLRYDRQWMLVDAANHFLSQRKIPRMALIQPELGATTLTLTAPDMPSLLLPLELTQGEAVEVQIWNDRCQALRAGAEADAWCSKFLGIDCRLVCQPAAAVRAVDPHYAQMGDQVYFSDGFPFLIIAENSLAALNRAMRLQLPMTRFRPNLVVAGCDAYAEDSWRRIEIGSMPFRLPKPCSRCTVPTVNPQTGSIDGSEPLVTLNRLRKLNNKVYFGQNALHDQCGTLQVGDRVVVFETGVPQPLLRA